MSAHRWSVSGIAVSRDGVKVFPAVCMNGCGETRDFPVEPERVKNGWHPTVSECRGTLSKAGNNITENVPNRICVREPKPEIARNISEPEYIPPVATTSNKKQEGENMHRPPLSGNEALIRAAHWKKLWPEILADVVKLGATATKKKYGIPDGTWQGWRAHRPEFKALLNGHKADPVNSSKSSNSSTDNPEPMPADLKAADAAMDKAARQEMMAEAKREDRTRSVPVVVRMMNDIADEWETKAKVLRAAAGVLMEVA